MKEKGLKILVMGMAGSGKTTLARELVYAFENRLHRVAIWYNADEIRNSINKHLGFGPEARCQQAYAMGFLADKAKKAGLVCICDFICPTEETFQEFEKGGDADFIIWHDRIQEGRYKDTNQIFTPPKRFDLRVSDETPSQIASEITLMLKGRIQITR